VQVLLDSNILGRLANLHDSSYAVATDAVAKLERVGDELFLTPQNLIEFRSFATRPLSLNGLGLLAVEADRLAMDFEADYSLLPDTPDIFLAWKTPVQSLGIVGKQVHDARLMAVCQVHQVTHLLTFNVVHFARFATATNPQVAILDPRTV
jgi:predicted nucleic acid-binding protein